MKRLKWGRITILLVIILGICWFLFQGTQKSVTNVEGQPLQVAELPKTGLTEKVVPPKYIPPEVDAKAAMIIDASNGDIIYQHNENEAFAPAAQTEGARIPVQVNDTLTVKDLFHALMIESANNSAVALAEHMAKTEKDFVQLMNAKAKQLKMSDYAKFANASGLQEPDGSETKMTAADVANLAYHLIKDYPEILEVTHLRQSQLAFNNINVISTNDMLNKNNKALYIEGIDGLKTGFTDSAGYCFTGTAKQGDTRIITVVMGTKGKTKRFTETNKLMTYAFGLVN
ncbi:MULTISPECIES: D-alanyl-D-alanine carboxypeptidase family protein [Bacillus]|uniref:Serine-type D-Ala-D-Ala carboxypeptidase n=3 Tax=Bacillus anthracis TaxID=1392 RepID=A0AAC8N342_BACAN|nr:MULTISPECIES: D-alanyl-D-alanine carboxypeptidase [Bacillus]EJT19075.1 D-alanyl-D-alanine carboxypeptidase [Bacillus anthracis str. UR-1]EXJ20569.1 D-alanyl-D-alanine carboxypeptidase [Bacillus anthracis str. 95014]AAP25845.1 serine-type D-Ala-D-Ala carboxypeptidase [Bacillus anthracis str. Ames]AAT31069.1 D-alanyl-D-alanine carboxypeptidase family protein [Bacillus anthracis str. 'Ames Ancestor']AAT54125.1 D-alanyl-D-alanine carboxypeptidase family protein [Bacillus anthracis str. Sterne]